MNSNRRQFICGCSAAVAAYAGSSFNTLAFGDQNLNRDHMIVIFLRGGMDGLNLMPPIGGSDRGHYQTARPNLSIPTTGPNAAVPLTGAWGLHPAAAPLKEIFDDSNLAIVQACGMAEVNRSHFDAERLMELGAPLGQAQNTGWITRHLATAENLPGSAQMLALAAGEIQPISLLGEYEAVNVAYPDYFDVDSGHWSWEDERRAALEALWSSASSWLHDSGSAAHNAMEIIRTNVAGGNYTPANGAIYPNSDFGDQMKMIAQMIKLGLGLQVATIDFGGWDTHEGQGEGSGGYFAEALDDLARSLNAFYNDLDSGGSNNYLSRTTVIVMSEFGREVRENSDYGTEHGYGNLMLVLGGATIGGLHGSWPGIHPNQLFEGTDITATTDYRRVLSEVLTRRMCNPAIDLIFPGYQGYTPIGVVEGNDILPNDIFADGFESGSTTAWG